MILLDVFVRCDDHSPFYNLSDVTLQNLDMFNVNSFCHLHSFFAHRFYPIVEFYVLRKQKQNKLPTATGIEIGYNEIGYKPLLFNFNESGSEFNVSHST